MSSKTSTTDQRATSSASQQAVRVRCGDVHGPSACLEECETLPARMPSLQKGSLHRCRGSPQTCELPAHMWLSPIDAGKSGCEGKTIGKFCSDQLDPLDVLCGHDAAMQDDTRNPGICLECGFKVSECMCEPDRDDRDESCPECGLVNCMCDHGHGEWNRNDEYETPVSKYTEVRCSLNAPLDSQGWAGGNTWTASH